MKVKYKGYYDNFGSDWSDATEEDVIYEWKNAGTDFLDKEGIEYKINADFKTDENSVGADIFLLVTFKNKKQKRKFEKLCQDDETEIEEIKEV